MSDSAEFGLYFPMKPVGQELVERAFKDVGEAMEDLEGAGEDMTEGLEDLEEQAGETTGSLDELKAYAGMTREEFEKGAGAFDNVMNGFDRIGSAANRVARSIDDLTKRFGIENEFLSGMVIPGLKSLDDTMDLITGTVHMASGIFENAMNIKTAAMWAFNVAANANPFVLIATAIIAGLALLYLAWQTNFGGIRDILTGVWNWLQEKFGWLIEIFEVAIPAALKILNDIWATVWGGIQAIIEGAWAIISPILEAIQAALDWVGDAVDAVEDAWNDAMGGSLRVAPETFRDLERLTEGLGEIGVTVGGVPETIMGGGPAVGTLNLNFYTGTLKGEISHDDLYRVVDEAILRSFRRIGISGRS